MTPESLMLFSFTSSIYPSAAYQHEFTQNTPLMQGRYEYAAVFKPPGGEWRAKGEEMNQIIHQKLRHLATESDKVSYSIWQRYILNEPSYSWYVSVWRTSFPSHKYMSFPKTTTVSDQQLTPHAETFLFRIKLLWPKYPLRHFHRDDGNKTFRYL